MTRVHIRTDDEVYRVDAVWLGPPRATFPWRARYSAYGVGLLVMLMVMFVQRQLGIALGFFSVAWALLITVAVTRFVSHRINDERPLLEWLTLFVHELRGPRVRDRGVGGALATGHVRVRRDRPRAIGGAMVALPRARDLEEDARVLPSAGPSTGATAANGAYADGGIGPAATSGPAASGVRATAGPTAASDTHVTPGMGAGAPTHGAAAPRSAQPGPAQPRSAEPNRAQPRSAPVRDRRRPPTASPGPDTGGFGPPSAADLGSDIPPSGTRRRRATAATPPPGLPAAADPLSAAAAVASWRPPRHQAAPDPVRVPSRRFDAVGPGPGGPPLPFSPAPEGPGRGAARARPAEPQEGDGAGPPNER